jgi:hypothetical protein
LNADAIFRKLAEAQEVLENATKASNDHADAVRKHIEALKRQEVNIDERLKFITQSETSDEALHQFELAMDKLRRLDTAKSHVELLKDVEDLRYSSTVRFYRYKLVNIAVARQPCRISQLLLASL